MTSFGTTNGDVFIAGAGNETLNAAGNTGSNSFIAGPGNTDFFSSMDTETFAFFNGSAVGADTVANFNANDQLNLFGYSSASTTISGGAHGSTMVSLSDGTKITLTNVISTPHIKLLLRALFRRTGSEGYS